VSTLCSGRSTWSVDRDFYDVVGLGITTRHNVIGVTVNLPSVVSYTMWALSTLGRVEGNGMCMQLLQIPAIFYSSY
jgi:hypothetical protein